MILTDTLKHCLSLLLLCRYSYNYPHGTAAAYKSGFHGYSTADGLAKISSYAQDFSGIAGYPVQSGIPAVTGFQELKSFASKTPSGFFGASGSIDRSEAHGIKSTGGPAHISFIKDFSKSPELGIKSEIVKVDHISPITGVLTSRRSSVHGAGALHKTQNHGISGEVKQAEVIFAQDIAGVSGQSGHRIAGAKPVAPFGDKLRTGGASAFAKPSSGYIHRAAAVHKTETQEFSGVGGPQISFTLGEAALRQPVSKTSTKLTAPTGSFAPKTPSRSIQKNEGQGVRSSGSPAHISFIKDFSKSTGQSHAFEIKPETVKFEHISPVAGGISSRRSSTHGAGSLQKTQSHGVSGVVEQGEIIFAQDIAGVSGQSGDRIAGVKPATSPSDKLRTGGAPAFAKQTSTHGAEFIQKVENHEIAGVGEQGEINFAQDKTGVFYPSGHRIAGNKPVEASGGASALAKQSTGYAHGVGAVHKTEEQGFSTVGGPGPQISFVLGGENLHQPNPKIAPSAKLSAPASNFAPRQPSTHGSGSFRNTGTQGFSGVNKQGDITFAQDIAAVSGQSGQHSAGAIPAIASYDKLKTRRVSVVPKQSSGYVHRSGTIQNSGPQISFTRGGAAHQQPGSKLVSFDKLAAPAVGVAPKPSYGQSGVLGALSKNTAQDFSKVSGPSRITFTQDFSRTSSHVGSKPFVSSFDKISIPAFPAAAVSHGHLSGQRNKATFATTVNSRPVQSPFAGIPISQTPKQLVVEQPTFTAIDGASPAHGSFGSFIGSPLSHRAEDKSILVPGHAGYLIDYKSTIALVDGSAGDKSSFGVVPQTTFDHDRPSVFKYGSVAGDGFADGRLYGIHHSSEAIGGHGELGGAIPSYQVSSAGHPGDKSGIFVAVPAKNYNEETTSVYLPSSGAAPSGTFAIDKGSILKLSGGTDSTISSHGQYGHEGYKAVATPFKSYYSSLYPGYSQISGESPRYGFSHDRSLLYSSPYLTSPFSYSYTSGKESQIYKKSDA